MKTVAAAAPKKPTVKMHFTNRSPGVRQIYDRILDVSRQFGPVKEDPKRRLFTSSTAQRMLAYRTGDRR
ncbi:MAG TPA: hypothetical protein VEV84_06815 [Pyrinomonadaceae bacterium]|nr:hypothetical protein [Pyrinomonadaceae bacterium]